MTHKSIYDCNVNVIINKNIILICDYIIQRFRNLIEINFLYGFIPLDICVYVCTYSSCCLKDIA